MNVNYNEARIFRYTVPEDRHTVGIKTVYRQVTETFVPIRSTQHTSPAVATLHYLHTVELVSHRQPEFGITHAIISAEEAASKISALLAATSSAKASDVSPQTPPAG